jgi:hypothetical protein
MVRVFDAYFIRDTPARSAAVYVHQLQKKAMMRGCQAVAMVGVISLMVKQIRNPKLEFRNKF